MTSKRLPTLCVVAGPNGSGKTSTTIQLLQNEWSEGSLYINPDNIAQEQFGDWNSPDAVMKAAKVATELRYKCLEEKKRVSSEGHIIFNNILVEKLFAKHIKLK